MNPGLREKFDISDESIINFIYKTIISADIYVIIGYKTKYLYGDHIQVIPGVIGDHYYKNYVKIYVSNAGTKNWTQFPPSYMGDNLKGYIGDLVTAAEYSSDESRKFAESLVKVLPPAPISTHEDAGRAAGRLADPGLEIEGGDHDSSEEDI